MIWPTLIVDNFLNDPIAVKNFALKQEYKLSQDGIWPGERTDFLHLINRNLFNSITTKIMTLLYPYETFYGNKEWNALCNFQKIKSQVTNTGWTHHDGDKEFTAIIYLSFHNNCGTSICEPKNFCNHTLYEKEKKQMFLNNDKKMIKYQKENNDNFIDTININSKFNRLLLFDAFNYHRVNQFEEKDVSEERLTLICFFSNIKNIKNNIKTPIPSSRRVLV